MSYYCKGSIYTDIQTHSVNRNWEGGVTMPFSPNVVTQMYIICSCLFLRELVDLHHWHTPPRLYPKSQVVNIQCSMKSSGLSTCKVNSCGLTNQWKRSEQYE